MAGQDKILWKLSLEGAEDVSKKLKAAGDVGDEQAKRLKKSFADVGTGSSGSNYGKFAQLAEGENAAHRFREAIHVLHPVLDSAGLGIGNLGAFARLAGAGLGGLAAAIAGSVIIGLAKLGDEAQKAKLHLGALGASGDTFDKLNERAKKLGISTSALLPGIEQYRAAVNKTDASNPSVSHPPGFVPGGTEEAASGVSIIGGGKETGGRVPLSTFLSAHGALVASGQSEKISGDEAAKQADAFEKKLLDNRKLTSDAVSELSPSAANNLAHALGPFFGTSLKDGAALTAQLDRPGAHLPSDNETLRALAKTEPQAVRQAEAAKGVVSGFEAVAAASKRLAERLAGDGAAIGKGLTAAAKVIDAIAAADYKKSDAGSGLAASATPPLLDILKALQGSKSANQTVKEDFDQLNDATPQSKSPREAPSSTTKVRTYGGAGDFTESVVPKRDAAAAAPTSGQSEYDADGIWRGGPTFPKFNADGSVNPYGGQSNNRPINDGYTHPNFQAPHNEAERQQQKHESATIGKKEAELQKIFNQNIRDQNGGNNPSPDKVTYGHTTLGHYDPRSQRFIANPRQPARDPNEVPGAPQPTTFPAYQRVLTKEFTDKYGPSGNPPGVENPFHGPPAQPAGDADSETPGSGSGAAPRKKIHIFPGADAANGPRSDVGDQFVDPDVAAATGGFISRDVGGHVRGPGTSTSDSIPAMLSDGEFVVKADSVKTIGVDRLNHANQNPEHFAGGGQAKQKKDPGLRGSYEVTYDPNTGGAYINGVLHLPGDPLLNDPIIKREVEESKAGAKDDSSQKAKHHSDFIDQGGVQFGGGFADGGPVGTAANILHDHLSRSFPALFSNGGIAARLSEAASDYGAHITESMGSYSAHGADLQSMKIESGKGRDLHPVTINMPDGRSIDGLRAPPDVVETLRSAAAMKNMVSTGKSPSWVGGS
jgi:hypothetical protein